MKNTTPRHRRANSKEFQTAIAIIEAFKQAGCLLPTPPLHKLPVALVDMIAVGMGTVKAEDLPAPPPAVTPQEQDIFNWLTDGGGAN